MKSPLNPHLITIHQTKNSLPARTPRCVAQVFSDSLGDAVELSLRRYPEAPIKVWFSLFLLYRPPQKRLYNDEFEGSLVPHSLAKQNYHELSFAGDGEGP